MANTEHNPSAFPVQGNDEHGFARVPGMTLRDYFAGQALQGICAYMRDNGVPFANSQEINESAQLAYSVADAMLVARQLPYVGEDEDEKISRHVAKLEREMSENIESSQY